MASGSPCLNSRWDQPKPKAGVLEGIMGSAPAPGSTAQSMGSSPPVVPGAVIPSAPDAPTQGGVEMATAMAAKLNAMLMAKGKLKPLQPLPSKVSTPSVPPPVTRDEIVVTEVDINDVPVNCRNLLTRSKTHEEIRQYSGALVSTKGLYMNDAERCSYAGGDRPLYLHVQGRSQDQVNKAVMRIKEIIAEDVMRASGGQQPAIMPPVPIYPQPPRPSAPSQPTLPTPRPPNTPVTPAHRPPPPHAGSFVHTKLFVGLEQSLPSFSVNEKVEGPSGAYLQHIQTETGARVFLRGKGSGYIEQASRRESFEPLYLYISHPNVAGLKAAKKLCESLLTTVRDEHACTASTYTASGSTQAGSHAYSSSGGYSSQSWYGYSSAYPSYPATAGSYWSRPEGGDGAQMVQYPVCPRRSTAFIVQDEDNSAECDSSSPPNSNSPKRHFLEEGDKNDDEEAAEEEEEEGGRGVERTEQSKPDDPVKETVFNADEENRSDGILMPPPPPPLKRPREEDPALTTPPGEEEEKVKKMKVFESSALVPYSGDSSDEEEERSKSSI